MNAVTVGQEVHLLEKILWKPRGCGPFAGSGRSEGGEVGFEGGLGGQGSLLMLLLSRELDALGLEGFQLVIHPDGRVSASRW